MADAFSAAHIPHLAVNDMIGENHPLRVLFRKALRAGFHYANLSDAEIEKYIEENVLVEFIHADRIYKVRSSQGGRVEAIADMHKALAENASQIPRSFNVHKHIGDYALFVTGVFPELLRHIRSNSTEDTMASLVASGDLFGYYVGEGRRAYAQAAGGGNRMFGELSRNFVSYADALTRARHQMDAMKKHAYEDFNGELLAT